MLGVLDHDAPEMASAWRFLEFEFASRNGFPAELMQSRVPMLQTLLGNTLTNQQLLVLS